MTGSAKSGACGAAGQLFLERMNFGNVAAGKLQHRRFAAIGFIGLDQHGDIRSLRPGDGFIDGRHFIP